MQKLGRCGIGALALILKLNKSSRATRISPIFRQLQDSENEAVALFSGGKVDRYSKRVSMEDIA